MKYLNFKLLFFLAALALAIPPAWAGTTYQKVTNRNQMVVGKQYILVYNNYAFGPLNSSGYGSEIEVTVNADGTVDIADAVAVADYIIGQQPASFVKPAADVNKDGNITISDATRIVDMVLP